MLPAGSVPGLPAGAGPRSGTGCCSSSSAPGASRRSSAGCASGGSSSRRLAGHDERVADLVSRISETAGATAPGRTRVLAWSREVLDDAAGTATRAESLEAEAAAEAEVAAQHLAAGRALHEQQQRLAEARGERRRLAGSGRADGGDPRPTVAGPPRRHGGTPACGGAGGDRHPRGGPGRRRAGGAGCRADRGAGHR